MRFTTIAAAVTGLSTLGAAHPGEHDAPASSELLTKRAMYETAKRGLEACSSKLAARGIEQRATARRAAVVAEKRAALAARKARRDEASVLATDDHNRTASGITIDTDESVLFASNGTCVINPVSEFGPFWVKGEYVRKDLVEDQPGVPVTIDGQFLDVETCEPIEGLYWDIWYVSLLSFSPVSPANRLSPLGTATRRVSTLASTHP